MFRNGGHIFRSPSNHVHDVKLEIVLNNRANTIDLKLIGQIVNHLRKTSHEKFACELKRFWAEMKIQFILCLNFATIKELPIYGLAHRFNL